MKSHSGPDDAEQAVSKLMKLASALGAIPAIHPVRAAAVLGVRRETVYRWIRNGDLECVMRQGQRWVSVRSLIRRIEQTYGSTSAFNALVDEIR